MNHMYVLGLSTIDITRFCDLCCNPERILHLCIKIDEKQTGKDRKDLCRDLSEVKNGNLELAGTVLGHTETKIYIYFVYKQSIGSR